MLQKDRLRSLHPYTSIFQPFCTVKTFCKSFVGNDDTNDLFHNVFIDFGALSVQLFDINIRNLRFNLRIGGEKGNRSGKWVPALLRASFESASKSVWTWWRLLCWQTVWIRIRCQVTQMLIWILASCIYDRMDVRFNFTVPKNLWRLCVELLHSSRNECKILTNQNPEFCMNVEKMELLFVIAQLLGTIQYGQ